MGVIEDTTTLENCERLFREGEQDEKRGQLKQAVALQLVRDQRLYREHFDTFEEYVEKRLGYTDRWAHQRIALAQVASQLNHGSVAITNERQARAIKPVLRDHGPEVAAEVLREAADDDGKLTARSISEAATRVVEPEADATMYIRAEPEPEVIEFEVITAEEFVERYEADSEPAPDLDDLLPEQSKFERAFWRHLRAGQELVTDLEYPHHFNEPMTRMLLDLIESLNQKREAVASRGLRVVNGGKQ